jgi:hypothetical protein
MDLYSGRQLHKLRLRSGSLRVAGFSNAPFLIRAIACDDSLLFKGMFEPLTNRSDGGLTNSYFESEIMGTAAFPEGVPTPGNAHAFKTPSVYPCWLVHLQHMHSPE